RGHSAPGPRGAGAPPPPPPPPSGRARGGRRPPGVGDLLRRGGIATLRSRAPLPPPVPPLPRPLPATPACPPRPPPGARPRPHRRAEHDAEQERAADRAGLGSADRLPGLNTSLLEELRAALGRDGPQLVEQVHHVIAAHVLEVVRVLDVTKSHQTEPPFFSSG